MGHDGMLYSLPSRDLIADCVEYMVNAHCADAMVCISNCDKITPGMLMAALRLNIPTVFVSGGPMEAGKVVLEGKLQALDLVDAMVDGGRRQVFRRGRRRPSRSRLPDLRLLLRHVHRQLDELPDRGARPVAARQRLDAGHPRRPQARCSCEAGAPDRRPRPALLRAGRRVGPAAHHRHLRGLRERHGARHRHGRLDQHGAAPPGRRPGGRASTSPWTTSTGSRRSVPCCARSRPAKADVPHGGRAPRRRHHGDPRRARPRRPAQPRRADRPRRRRWATRSTSWDIAPHQRARACATSSRAAPGGVPTQAAFSQADRWDELDLDRENGCIRDASTPSPRTAASPCSTATSPSTAAS